MIGILEWTDDLIGQVVKYKDEEIILITDWVDRRSALAWSYELPSDLITVALEQCEMTHIRADERLCSLAMRAWMIGGYEAQVKLCIYQALGNSVDDEIPSRVVTEDLERAARGTKGLIGAAKKLEQLTDPASSKPDTPHYEYAVQHCNSAGEWEYYWGDDEDGPVFVKEPIDASWQDNYEAANAEACRLAEHEGEYRVVRRVVGEPEFVE